MTKAFLTRSTAMVVLLALPLATAPVAAQQSTTQSTTQEQSTAERTEQADAPDTAETDSAMTEAPEPQSATGGADTVVVTVGDAEISGSDVMRAIGMLPATIRQQPAELLLPIALQQLVLRELILDRARTENVAADPNFTAMAEKASAEATEDATVQFWLQRELADAVTDEAVNSAYERLTSYAQGQVPTLDAVRPQIEQELRRLAMDRVRRDLQAQGPEIVFLSQGQQESSYSDNSFCTADYAPDNQADQTGSEFAEMDLDGDGMVSQQEYQKCRAAAAEN